MGSDKLEKLGPLMNEIGQELAETVGGDPNGVFLYVEIGEGWVDISIFKDEGKIVRWYDSQRTNLADLIWEAWYLEPDDPNMRWSVLEYEVRDRKFHVSLKYPEEVNVEIVDDERRETVLRARFGDKPVIYPPPPKSAFELQP
ncbi:MAG: hypothetical protein AABZ76_00115 [Pseudomonadota bacterium]|jgi:hypothetical protein|uniref:Uncharacterized protein n=1 Tax=Sphingobium yanoikuyae TaxID=13690 RepID=A0A291N613_SPHYA|nr:MULTISPECIES: hypothetical protein [Sphingobium]ATI82776.1 hypothetical protein A6768_24085 [Sphingobium yanoikuyae]MBT2242823.1 hypothetical protein [Sphingobium sp. BHU LFT2]NBB40277.1 hypothetical protein [Sphingobium yanoikuyae]